MPVTTGGLLSLVDLSLSYIWCHGGDFFSLSLLIHHCTSISGFASLLQPILREKGVDGSALYSATHQFLTETVGVAESDATRIMFGVGMIRGGEEGASYWGHTILF